MAIRNFLTHDDEYFDGLATDWFFLDLFFRTAEIAPAERVVDTLIDVALRLKPCLKQCGHTYLKPRNICVDENVYFDIWLDAEGEIQVSGLYADQPEDPEL